MNHGRNRTSPVSRGRRVDVKVRGELDRCVRMGRVEEQQPAVAVVDHKEARHQLHLDRPLRRRRVRSMQALTTSRINTHASKRYENMEGRQVAPRAG